MPQHVKTGMAENVKNLVSVCSRGKNREREERGMLPVYLCEDDENIRAMEVQALEKQILIQGFDMELACVTARPEALLEVVKRNRKRGVYFLDVELKGESMDGFALGAEIRKLDPRGFLIYVTAFRDLAFETFRHHLEALDYIVKENQEEMLDGIGRCLLIVQERLLKEKAENQPYFTVRILDTVRHIPISDICFFETGGRTHRIILHAVNERMDFIGSLQEIEKQPGNRFVRAHRAYLINPEHIQELDLKHNEVRMKNGEVCFVSRSMKGKLLAL